MSQFLLQKENGGCLIDARAGLRHNGLFFEPTIKWAFFCGVSDR